LTLLGIAATGGSLLFGENRFWPALTASALTFLIEPLAATALIFRLHGSRVLHPH